MGAVDQVVLDPAKMDPETTVADEAEPVEAVADVAEQVVAVAEAADRAEVGRAARAGMATGTTAAPCRIFDAISVGTEITSKPTAAGKRQHESLRPWRRWRSQNSCCQTSQAMQDKQTIKQNKNC